jgi:hypothetical protein
VVPNHFRHFRKDAGLFLLSAFFTIVALSVNGQLAIPSLHKNVDLPSENIRFDLLLKLITKQTGVKFSLNTQKFKLSTVIHVQKGVQSVDQILSEVKKSIGIYYAFLGEHIIFLDKLPLNTGATTATAAAEPKNTDPPATDPAPLPLVHPQEDLARENIGTDKNVQAFSDRISSVPMENEHPVQVDKDLVARAGGNKTASGSKRNRPTSGQTTTSGQTDASRSTPATSAPKARAGQQSSPFQPGFMLEAGLSADELFYFDPSLQIRWKFLYAVARLNTNFSVAGLQYGIGVALPINQKWQMAIIATNGSYSKTYPFNISDPISPITTFLTMQLRSDLENIALLAKVRVRPNLQLQFGPVLNRLVSTFLGPGGGQTPVLFGGSLFHSSYEYLKPPYTTQDNFDPLSAQDTQLWLGFQVGLFYSINFSKSR